MVGETVCVVRRISVRRLWWSDILRLWLSMMSWPALLIEWCDESSFSFPLFEVEELTPAAELPKVNDCKCCLGISYPSLAEEQGLCNVELVERKWDLNEFWDGTIVVIVLLGIDWEEHGRVIYGGLEPGSTVGVWCPLCNILTVYLSRRETNHRIQALTDCPAIGCGAGSLVIADLAVQRSIFTNLGLSDSAVLLYPGRFSARGSVWMAFFFYVKISRLESILSHWFR